MEEGRKKRKCGLGSSSILGLCLGFSSILGQCLGLVLRRRLDMPYPLISANPWLTLCLDCASELSETRFPLRPKNVLDLVNFIYESESELGETKGKICMRGVQLHLDPKPWSEIGGN